LVSYLAAGELTQIKKAFTGVTQDAIFSNNPFIINKKGKVNRIKINHFNVLKNFLKGRKTFEESKNLRRLIEQKVSKRLFDKIKKLNKEVVISVSNFTVNKTEYKALSECNHADGGFGCIFAIEEAIRRGATEIDAIMLNTEV